MAMTTCVMFWFSCLMITGQATHPTDSLAIRLARLEAGLTLLDIRQKSVENHTALLLDEMADVQRMQASVQDAIHRVHREQDKLGEAHNGLQNLSHQVLEFKHRLDHSAGTNTTSNLPNNPIHFHVRMAPSDPSRPAPDTPIIMTKVVDNPGNGYNPHTGTFTAPLSGVYCFLASVTASEHGVHAGAFLMVGDSMGRGTSTRVDYMESTAQSGAHQSMSVQGVVHLEAGQQAWLQVSMQSYFWYGPSSFSGFLVHGG